MHSVARRMFGTASLSLVVLAATAAPAAVESRIDYDETYFPHPNESADTVYTSGTLRSDHAIRWQYPVVNFSVANNRAYVDPIAHKLGAQAVADATGTVIGAPGDLPIDWHSTDRKIAGTSASFVDQLTVTSTTLPLNAPVRLQVTLRIDGRAQVGLPHTDPGSTTVDAHGSAGFTITDPTLTRPDPERPGHSVPAGPIASLYASAHTLQETAAPNPYNPYALNGVWTRTFDSYWSAYSNTGQELGGSESDSLDFVYPTGSISQSGGGYRNGITVDTGLVTLFFDTYVGAQLDIAGGISAYAYSSLDSAEARADFLHTMGFDFAAAPGFETAGLSLDLASAAVPEPATLTLLTLPAMLLVRRRRHA